MNTIQPMTLEQGREHLRFANSYNRLGIMIEIAWRMEARDWITLLGENWPSCDNIGHYLEQLEDTPFGDTLDDAGFWRDVMMSPDERAAYAALPDRIIIYRGCYSNNKWGLSWSLEHEVAARFPFLNRYRQNGQALLVKAVVPKHDVVALKLDRAETEVICWRPKHISTSKLRRE